MITGVHQELTMRLSPSIWYVFGGGMYKGYNI